LRAGLLAVIVSVSLGMVLGLMAGFFGGWLDTLIVWLVDVLLAFPGILLAIALASALGAGTLIVKLPFLPFSFELSSIEKALIAISITQIPIFIRIARASVISLRESEFVHAAKSLGAPPQRIMWLHVLPNGLSPILIQLTLSIGTVVLDMAALGFLGLGAQPPEPEWGAMISDGFGRFRSAPWLSIFPGLAIFFTVVGFNLLGDAIRDVLDPRLKNIS
jgi:peptide/nickel transport system permease protein